MDVEEQLNDRGHFRFYADRLPVSKRPIVVMRTHRDSDGLDCLDSDAIFLTLEADASLHEARTLADRLNDSVDFVSVPAD